jgi:hypothetical protein
MPTMKVTPDAAMRARDVSRPRAEHLERTEGAEGAQGAEAAEASVTAATDVVIEADVVMDIPDPEYPSSEERPADAGWVDGTRRRRVRSFRSSSRRGRPSR